jgi:hypothetical protein
VTRLEEATPDRFPDPLDPTSKEHQAGNSRQQGADRGTGTLAVGVPEIRAPENGDPRAERQERLEAMRPLIVASAYRCGHDNTPAG